MDCKYFYGPDFPVFRKKLSKRRRKCKVFWFSSKCNNTNVWNTYKLNVNENKLNEIKYIYELTKCQW